MWTVTSRIQSHSVCTPHTHSSDWFLVHRQQLRVYHCLSLSRDMAGSMVRNHLRCKVEKNQVCIIFNCKKSTLTVLNKYLTHFAPELTGHSQITWRQNLQNRSKQEHRQRLRTIIHHCRQAKNYHFYNKGLRTLTDVFGKPCWEGWIPAACLPLHHWATSQLLLLTLFIHLLFLAAEELNKLMHWSVKGKRNMFLFST